MSRKLLDQLLEVNDHLIFIQKSLLFETLIPNTTQFIAQNKLVSCILFLIENLAGSDLAELNAILKVATTLYDKYRLNYPFFYSSIRAIKNSGSSET